MSEQRGASIHVSGVVQGVGFRPFIYSLAKQLALNGWVRNTSAGVDIELDGSVEALSQFVRALKEQAPPLASIDEISVQEREPDGYSDFAIVPSEPLPDAFQPLSPDVSTCDDCLNELFDRGDRRYRYPFINCTNCGPRFTIITDIPYDRPNTTMAPFRMCPPCAEEYQNPLDRRYHAQPIACPDCGPMVWFEVAGERQADREEAIQAARRALAEGRIVAIKGLGGFHLACDATNADTVEELRARKLRVDKPFALMMPDLPTVERHCEVTQFECQLLQRRERPIVILERLRSSAIAQSVAPGQNTLGVMLPYTPLHHLLLEPAEGFPSALVMTSGNLSEEPLATGNEEARARLVALADAFLMHDRDIRTRCDDSVVRSYAGTPYPLRRARGYAPFPLRLPWRAPALLATGPEKKNTFCLVRGEYAFLSQHIGEMENYETMRSFEDGIAHNERLFRIQPEILAYDLHPDYMATRYAHDRARRENLPSVGVQHHHAHLAACMAEHALDSEARVIGAIFDGTGYGADGVIWGGEIMVAGYATYERFAHLTYVPMPGGDAAVLQPWRMALSWLDAAGLPWTEELACVHSVDAASRETLRSMLRGGIQAPLTSSMGRLFDAVAALIGIRQVVNYEAQAAIELEACVDPDETGKYRLAIEGGELDPAPALAALVRDIRRGVPAGVLSARFHNGLAEGVVEVCTTARERTGLDSVVLSGGVWQNLILFRRTAAGLRERGFRVLAHQRVPANDGGVALGQAVIAMHQLGVAESINSREDVEAA